MSSTMERDGTREADVQQRVQKLEEGLKVAETTQAGAQATQAAAQAGLAASVVAGGAGVIAGMVIALLIALVARD
jgi:cellobiose-specific phosphotransferase system component IIC